MQKPTFDPGLTTQYNGPLTRVINPDGTFNVIRQGTDWRDVHPYLAMVSAPWTHFFGVILAAYILTTTAFAAAYFFLGPNAIHGGTQGSPLDRFFECVFFSSQTLTTVGYGALAPLSKSANVVSAFEALVGLLGFAVATGLMFGRVSRPSARIGFSEHAMISPYQDITAFQFRIVNRRANTLIEPAVTLMMMTVKRDDGSNRRDFSILKLEREKIMLFPLTWTVVHPIDSESPLFGKTIAELQEMQTEFMVLVKAFDETFGQTVHQRFSYRYHDIVWGGKFTPAFGVDESGNLQVNLDKVGQYEIQNRTP